MPIPVGKTQLSVVLTNHAFSHLQTAAELLGVSKSELIEDALTMSERISTVFNDQRVGLLAHERAREHFLRLIAEQMGQEEADALRKEGEENAAVFEVPWGTQMALIKEALRKEGLTD